MFPIYLKTAWRNITRPKGYYSLINSLGKERTWCILGDRTESNVDKVHFARVLYPVATVGRHELSPVRVTGWIMGWLLINSSNRLLFLQFLQRKFVNIDFKIQIMFSKIILSMLLLLVLGYRLHAQIQTVSGRVIPIAAMDKFLHQQMDSLAMPGLSIAIINHGKIVYHRAIGIANVDSGEPITDSSIFEAASLSKPVFAYLVMKMVDQHLLNLDTPLYKYMPYPDIEKDERYKLITARIALTHQTGFPNWRYFDMADSSMHVKYGDLYMKFTPGTKFYYSGEGFLYLAKVIAYLKGLTLQTLETLYEAEVARPLGMNHAWFTGNAYINKYKASGHVNGKPYFYNGTPWPISFPNWDSSYFNPAASLHTEAVGYAHFVIGLMKHKGLSSGSYREMMSPQIMLPKDNTNVTENGDTAWGLGIAIAQTKYGTRYEHGGNNNNFQSAFLFYKQQQNGYVFLTNCDKGSIFNKRLREFLTEGK